MSLFRISIISALILSSCTFEPIYKAQGNLDWLNLKIKNSNDMGYAAHRLRTALTPLLKTIKMPQNKKITVELDIKEIFDYIGYASDVTVVRSQGHFIVDLDILQNYNSIHKKKLTAITSYTIDENEEFTNLSAQNAARERLIQQIALDISREIAFVLKKKCKCN
ncbi:MAG: hypothetical protein ACTSXG_03055 [Alphaproteobacteria bacterium]